MQAALASPQNGYVTVSFDGVSCPIVALRKPPSGTNFIDIECTLGEVPGGLVHYGLLEVTSLGRARGGVNVDPARPGFWIVLPLSITGVTDAQGASTLSTSSMGGGWTLKISGVGFAPPPSTGAESFVQVDVCGRLCSVTKANPSPFTVCYSSGSETGSQP